MLPRVTSGGYGLPKEGHLLPQRVAGDLGGSGVALGYTDSLVDLQMASGTVGGFMGSWVTMGGR
jgi:hypothetical protein